MKLAPLALLGGIAGIVLVPVLLPTVPDGAQVAGALMLTVMGVAAAGGIAFGLIAGPIAAVRYGVARGQLTGPSGEVSARQFNAAFMAEGRHIVATLESGSESGQSPHALPAVTLVDEAKSTGVDDPPTMTLKGTRYIVLSAAESPKELRRKARGDWREMQDLWEAIDPPARTGILGRPGRPARPYSFTFDVGWRLLRRTHVAWQTGKLSHVSEHFASVASKKSLDEFIALFESALDTVAFAFKDDPPEPDEILISAKPTSGYPGHVLTNKRFHFIAPDRSDAVLGKKYPTGVVAIADIQSCTVAKEGFISNLVDVELKSGRVLQLKAVLSPELVGHITAMCGNGYEVDRPSTVL
jgi:hypothetical protein